MKPEFVKNVHSLSCVYIGEGYVITLATAAVILTCLGHLGRYDINRNEPISVAPPMVTKESK